MCDNFQNRPNKHLINCPKCGHYAYGSHWLKTGGKCPACGMHQIPNDILLRSAEKNTSFKPAFRLACRLTILNNYYFARGLAHFAKTALTFEPETVVFVTFDKNTVSGSSIIDLLTLGPIRGQTLHIEAIGPRSREILEALTEVVNNGFYADFDDYLPIPKDQGVIFDPSL